jgi:hypothetical protein
MICPKCNRPIYYVYVRSECCQQVTLFRETNKTEDYCSPKIGKTVEINCPVCDGDITSHIKES